MLPLTLKSFGLRSTDALLIICRRVARGVTRQWAWGWGIPKDVRDIAVVHLSHTSSGLIWQGHLKCPCDTFFLHTRYKISCYINRIFDNVRWQGFFFTLFVNYFVGLLKPVLLQTQYESLFQSAAVCHCYLSSIAIQFCFRVAQLV